MWYALKLQGGLSAEHGDKRSSGIMGTRTSGTVQQVFPSNCELLRHPAGTVLYQYALQ
jgi:hypothetical protein